ncbi:MAG: methyltransferase domain-containing protein [Acidobacteria bacterium]|nr:methyltransferase domain-containing protein [Acidobacteriota bacterium]
MPELPPVDNGAAVRSIYVTGDGAVRFDVDLLEELNREYAPKPVVGEPPKYDVSSLAERARRRVMRVHDAVDLSNKRVLEVGCGRGYEVWYVANHLGSEAHGMDVQEYPSWTSLAGERVRYHLADFTRENPFPPDGFDRVYSFTAWEHIVHPRRAFAETFKVLRPGGLAWIRANLYRGSHASHLYRDIFFPWPHLLFSDEVIKEFFRRHGKPERGAAWVNRLTWEQYERIIEDIGFELRTLAFTERPFDEEFYRRFEGVLGRYPRADLTREYFTVVLEKSLA